MRNFLQNLSYKMQNFMQGRYGRDELSNVLNIAAIVFLILAFIGPRFFVYIALAILVWSLIRSYSKNRAQLIKELEAYLKIKRSIVNKYKLVKGMWRDRNTHLYCKCPNCKTVVRIPKPSKGKTIRINCPKCRNSFEKRT